MRNKSTCLFLLIVVILFNGCKKYPENTLILTPPYRALYSVLSNGIVEEISFNNVVIFRGDTNHIGIGIEGGYMGRTPRVSYGCIACDTLWGPKGLQNPFLLKDIKFTKNYNYLMFVHYEWRVLKLTNKELVMERYDEQKQLLIKMKLRREY